MINKIIENKYYSQNNGIVGAVVVIVILINASFGYIWKAPSTSPLLQALKI